MLAAAAVAFGACSSSGATSAPRGCLGGALRAGAARPLKIGLVTDVGTLNDKNFNQYSWEGTQDGATRIGAAAPKSAVSTVSADIAKNIQSFVDQKFDIIVTVGFAAGTDTIKAAKANPNIKFIGVDQAPLPQPRRATSDNTFAVQGRHGQADARTPGHPVVRAAAGLPRRHRRRRRSARPATSAAIGGTASVPAVPNYIVGYLNGAKSVNPNIKVELPVRLAPPRTRPRSPIRPAGKAFAKQMLSANTGVDVIFQVAGLTGNGVLQAACDAKIYGIGVDVDQFVSTPETAKCTVVSAEKKLKKNVSDAISRIAKAPTGRRRHQARHQDRRRRPVAVPRLPEPDHARHPEEARRRRRRHEGRHAQGLRREPFGGVRRPEAAPRPPAGNPRRAGPGQQCRPARRALGHGGPPMTGQTTHLGRGDQTDRRAAGARDARHHEALPGRRRQRQHRPHCPARARSTRCSARTAPASPRS